MLKRCVKLICLLLFIQQGLSSTLCANTFDSIKAADELNDTCFVNMDFEYEIITYDNEIPLPPLKGRYTRIGNRTYHRIPVRESDVSGNIADKQNWSLEYCDGLYTTVLKNIDPETMKPLHPEEGFPPEISEGNISLIDRKGVTGWIYPAQLKDQYEDILFKSLNRTPGFCTFNICPDEPFFKIAGDDTHWETDSKNVSLDNQGNTTIVIKPKSDKAEIAGSSIKLIFDKKVNNLISQVVTHERILVNGNYIENDYENTIVDYFNLGDQKFFPKESVLKVSQNGQNKPVRSVFIKNISVNEKVKAEYLDFTIPENMVLYKPVYDDTQAIYRQSPCQYRYVITGKNNEAIMELGPDEYNDYISLKHDEYKNVLSEKRLETAAPKVVLWRIILFVTGLGLIVFSIYKKRSKNEDK